DPARRNRNEYLVGGRRPEFRLSLADAAFHVRLHRRVPKCLGEARVARLSAFSVHADRRERRDVRLVHQSELRREYLAPCLRILSELGGDRLPALQNLTDELVAIERSWSSARLCPRTIDVADNGSSGRVSDRPSTQQSQRNCQSANRFSFHGED